MSTGELLKKLKHYQALDGMYPIPFERSAVNLMIEALEDLERQRFELAEVKGKFTLRIERLTEALQHYASAEWGCSKCEDSRWEPHDEHYRDVYHFGSDATAIAEQALKGLP